MRDRWCIIAIVDIDNEEDCFTMEKILFVNACVRPESRTYVLAQHVLDKLDGDHGNRSGKEEILLPQI